MIDRLAYLLPIAQDDRNSFSDTAPTSGEKDLTRLVSSLHELLAAKKAWLNDKNQDDIIQDLLSQLASLNLPKKGQESVDSEKDRGKQCTFDVLTFTSHVAIADGPWRTLCDVEIVIRSHIPRPNHSPYSNYQLRSSKAPPRPSILCPRDAREHHSTRS